MLTAYNSLICYKLSDDGVSKLRLMVTVRERKVYDDALVAGGVHRPKLF